MIRIHESLSLCSGSVLRNIAVEVKRVVESRPLNSQYLDHAYPANFTPFYLYGNHNEKNVDHMLLLAPKTEVSGDGVTLEFDDSLTDEQLASGPILWLKNLRRTHSAIPKQHRAPKESLFLV